MDMIQIGFKYEVIKNHQSINVASELLRFGFMALIYMVITKSYRMNSKMGGGSMIGSIGKSKAK